jgi:nitrous oxidase accessory protein
VVLRGLTVTGSGSDLAAEDSGIFVTARGAGAVIEDNRLEDNLIGVNLKGPPAAVVRHNRIEGRHDARMSERGNGVSIWNSPGSVIEGNEISFGRDGIFVLTSRDNVFRGNRFRELRFAVHYMYANKGTVAGNDSAGNHVGYALMYSAGLTVQGNRSDGDRDHGLLLNYANGARIEGNAMVRGGEKCVFIYNSNKNIFRGNWFEGCEIGIHFTAGSEGNAIAGNAFIGNRTQVKYVGTRHLDWSAAGRGNYWSDNPAFDLNGDGTADQAYRPNDLVDQLVWSYPLAKLLLNSPAMQTVRFAQARFPALLPGGVVDSAPLMVPPRVPAAMAAEPGG